MWSPLKTKCIKMHHALEGPQPAACMTLCPQLSQSCLLVCLWHLAKVHTRGAKDFYRIAAVTSFAASSWWSLGLFLGLQHLHGSHFKDHSSSLQEPMPQLVANCKSKRQRRTLFMTAAGTPHKLTTVVVSRVVFGSTKPPQHLLDGPQ